ncbi:MAG: adenosine deaminase [Bacteroidota bacterium]
MNIKHLPKVELHLHLDCGLSYEVVSRLNPAVTREIYQEEFVAPAKCLNLADFLTRAVKGYKLMQTAEALTLVIEDMFRQLAASNLVYAEVRFAPLQHLDGGLTSFEVVDIANKAFERCIYQFNIEARLILCTLRHYSADQSMETVKLVEQFKGTTVVGFDIAADEAGFPIDPHIAAFKYAREKGIFITAHAGESRGADSVWETLEHLRPTRIGHGVRSIEDPLLVNYLIAQNIHLEICPSCNVQINLYDAFTDHPINELYRAGVSLNVNTDAPAIVDTTLNREYQLLADNFDWTATDFYTCNVNAVKAAFISAELKEKLLQKLGEQFSLPNAL